MLPPAARRSGSATHNDGYEAKEHVVRGHHFVNKIYHKSGTHDNKLTSCTTSVQWVVQVVNNPQKLCAVYC